ncbi:unnamed protein product, partial [Didymodactylos carnosus]
GWILPVVRGGRAVMGASVIVDSVMPRGGDMFAGTRDGDKFVGYNHVSQNRSWI